MDFNYTEEQLALQDTLRRFIAKDYGFEASPRAGEIGRRLRSRGTGKPSPISASSPCPSPRTSAA
jgi:hypothetical protein